jgi:hypothetical protein
MNLQARESVDMQRSGAFLVKFRRETGRSHEFREEVDQDKACYALSSKQWYRITCVTLFLRSNNNEYLDILLV